MPVIPSAHRRSLRLAPFILAAATIALSPASAQQTPPGRTLGPVLTRSAEPFGRISRVVQVDEGRILVDDRGRRVLMHGDTSLARWSIVLDSARGTDASYDSNGLLAAYRGDSAMFYAPDAAAILIIDPRGKIARIAAPPSIPPGTLGRFMPADHRLPLVSPSLGLVYALNVQHGPIVRPAAGEPDLIRRAADSSIILRMNLSTRAVDTLARIAKGSGLVHAYGSAPEAARSTPMLYPFADGVVVTSDGSIAILRARELRIEWIGPDGTRASSSRIPFAWRAITAGEKHLIVDSVNAVRRAAYDSAIAKRAADSARTGSPPMTTALTVTASGERFERRVPASPPRPPILATLEDVPDFYPPTARTPLLADGDNNVWIRERSMTSQLDSVAWSVVDRRGDLIDRIVVPAGETIVGFAPGGIVYTTLTDGGVATLQRRRFR